MGSRVGDGHRRASSQERRSSWSIFEFDRRDAPGRRWRLRELLQRNIHPTMISDSTHRRNVASTALQRNIHPP